MHTSNSIKAWFKNLETLVMDNGNSLLSFAIALYANEHMPIDKSEEKSTDVWARSKATAQSITSQVRKELGVAVSMPMTLEMSRRILATRIESRDNYNLYIALYGAIMDTVEAKTPETLYHDLYQLCSEIVNDIETETSQLYRDKHYNEIGRYMDRLSIALANLEEFETAKHDVIYEMARKCLDPIRATILIHRFVYGSATGHTEDGWLSLVKQCPGHMDETRVLMLRGISNIFAENNVIDAEQLIRVLAPLDNSFLKEQVGPDRGVESICDAIRYQRFQVK